MLKNLTVLDASTVLAGPSVATFFAELGARVIKFEHPACPDVTRTWKLPSEDPNSRVSAYFASVNYAKQYRQLDLNEPDSRADFLLSIAKADILIMNFKRLDYEKFQLTDENLQALNPRLIIAKINGYGNESDRGAYDLILQAESGFMAMNGQADGPPTKMPVALIDVLAAHHLKEAILLSLYQRECTGLGKSVSVSLFDVALSSLTNQASNYLMTGHLPQRMGSLHPNIAPYGELFTTMDGCQVTFAIGSDAHFRKLCDVLGIPDIAESDDFCTNQSRIQNRTKLADIIQIRVKYKKANSLLERLHSVKVPVGVVKDLRAVFEDPAARSLIREEYIDGIPTQRMTSVIFREGDPVS